MRWGSALAALLLFAGAAHAAEPLGTNLTKMTPAMVMALRSTPSDLPTVQPSTDATGAAQAGPLAGLADLFASDFSAAETLATNTSIKDGNGAACWTAFAPLGEVLKAHPGVFTGKLATDIEAKRLAIIAARHLCDNVACNVVFTEEAVMAQKFIGNLPISISVNATPINLFAQACANVPTLQLVAPTAQQPMPGN